MQPKTSRNCAPATSPPASAPAHSLRLRVYYEDTDAGGVVYYANYLKYCERARTEWLRALGIAQQALLDTSGIGFMVRSVQAEYLSSARLDDELMVASRIQGLRRASIVFDQQVRRGGEVLFTARTLVASIDIHRHKPTAIPAHLHALLESQA